MKVHRVFLANISTVELFFIQRIYMGLKGIEGIHRGEIHQRLLNTKSYSQHNNMKPKPYGSFVLKSYFIIYQFFQKVKSSFKRKNDFFSPSVGSCYCCLV